MHVLHGIKNTPWPSVPFGTLRLWDTDGTGWYQINTARGKYNWSGLDRWLDLAHKHHVEVIYTFGRVPTWANGSNDHAIPPKDLKDWDTFVRAIVRHADGRIHYWELWNEPNDADFWKGASTRCLKCQSVRTASSKPSIPVLSF